MYEQWRVADVLGRHGWRWRLIGWRDTRGEPVDAQTASDFLTNWYPPPWAMAHTTASYIERQQIEAFAAFHGLLEWAKCVGSFRTTADIIRLAVEHHKVVPLVLSRRNDCPPLLERSRSVGRVPPTHSRVFQEGTPTPRKFDAQPFKRAQASLSDGSFQLAAGRVSEAREAECFVQYEIDMDTCDAIARPMGGLRGLAVCQQNAFSTYQQCRGF